MLLFPKRRPPTFAWRAVYKDGTVLEEGPGAYPQIDRARLAAFQFVCGEEVLLSFVPDGKAWSYRKRGRIHMGARGREDTCAYLVGCAGGPICALWPDGRVEVLAEGWREGDEWFAPPILRPEEE